MQSEERKVYRSKDGKLHETIQAAADYNLAEALAKVVNEVRKTEGVCLHHWITKHPAELEAMDKMKGEQS